MYLLTCTGNVNIPELRTVARCASEQSHENLHKVHWTHSVGLRNCFFANRNNYFNAQNARQTDISHKR